MSETPERPAGSPGPSPTPSTPSPGGAPDAEPTQQFTRPYPGYPGPTGPPPSAETWLFGEQAPPAPPQPVKEKKRRGRAGFAAGVVAAALICGGGAGYGGAALWDATQDEPQVGSIFSGSSSDGTTTAAPAPEGTIQAVAEAVLPSVVKIEVAGGGEQGSGSGIILTADGYVLTNEHVVAVAGDGGQIRVDFNDGSSAPATIVGTDPLTDTAVIKVEGVSDLKPATIGRSESLQVGQTVIAIGSPFGLDSTVTSGIVSALNRPVNVGADAANNATVYPAIQTDAAINPGNSGGPLVDMEGRVVGINASIRTTSGGLTDEAGSIGLGFAIPIDEVGPIVDQMMKGEEPTHARLGISVSDVGAPATQQPEGDDNPFPDFGQPEPEEEEQRPEQESPFAANGAEIREVGDGSTAERAGLQVGDIITKVDDQLIVGSDSLVATIRSYRPGDEVRVTYTRNGEEHTVTLKLDSDAGSSTS